MEGRKEGRIEVMDKRENEHDCNDDDCVSKEGGEEEIYIGGETAGCRRWKMERERELGKQDGALLACWLC